MLETVKYILDYFFSWTTFGNFWHFVMLAFLCWLLGSPNRVTVDNSISNPLIEDTEEKLKSE